MYIIPLGPPLVYLTSNPPHHPPAFWRRRLLSHPFLSLSKYIHLSRWWSVPVELLSFRTQYIPLYNMLDIIVFYTSAPQMMTLIHHVVGFFYECVSQLLQGVIEFGIIIRWHLNTSKNLPNI